MINKKRFFDSYRATFGKLRASQVLGIDTVIDCLNTSVDITDLRQIAYMLATIKHECANTWKPIEEYGPNSYFAKYEFNTNLGRDLGNIYPGDGLLYKGRGYAMITGRANYFRFSRRLDMPVGLDLIAHPDRALNAQLAFRILTIGCTEGLFTGLCLGKFINTTNCDYRNARRVINGLDKAKEIESMAISFESILRKSL